jgi:hypothetical protein
LTTLRLRSCFRSIAIAGAIAVVSIAAAQRKPTVTYGVSGTSGNYTLNFNVQNNLLTGEGWLYFFGVLMPGRDITGSPASWNPDTWTSWNNSGYGGSSTVYNNVWIGNSGGGAGSISPGTSLNGFVVHTTTASAPTSVQFFAFAFGGTYNGNDSFNSPSNPGFEGNASPVPEPMSLIVIAAGAVALMRRRKR